MAQHFLLSAKARTLSLRSIYAAGEESAYVTFCQLRWPETNGEPVCPECGCADVYRITTRRRFKCAACRVQFSVTSGTIFASRKMAFVDLLAAVAIVANAAKGISALQLARDLDCQHKTAFVLAHKIREALASESDGAMLSGEVEIDGAYFGGHIALRQRQGRTLTFVDTHEPKGVEIARRVVAKGSTIVADEATHWDALPAHYPTQRINHSLAYSLDGVSTNMVESFFSRLRRMVTGQHHHVSARYLGAYAAHAAWLEDHRRLDNGTLSFRALGLAMAHPTSRTWAGYWQRSRA